LRDRSVGFVSFRGQHILKSADDQTPAGPDRSNVGSTWCPGW
jgi:hypothetical protein